VISANYRRNRIRSSCASSRPSTPPSRNLDLHLVLDNYATHKMPAVKAWLIKHARFHLHFTPTSSSWLNLVERWFAELTNR
jgi:transposase